MLLAATVLRAREKTETLANTSFIHCVAETAGAQFEVILAGGQKPPSPPRKGHILEGWFALSGTMSRAGNGPGRRYYLRLDDFDRWIVNRRPC